MKYRLKMVPPLEVEVLGGATPIATFYPVEMDDATPSQSAETWLAFVVTSGRRLPLGNRNDLERVQWYMREHGSEALSTDGGIAFTLARNALIECDPTAVFAGAAQASDVAQPRRTEGVSAPAA